MSLSATLQATVSYWEFIGTNDPEPVRKDFRHTWLSGRGDDYFNKSPDQVDPNFFDECYDINQWNSTSSVDFEFRSKHDEWARKQFTRKTIQVETNTAVQAAVSHIVQTGNLKVIIGETSGKWHFTIEKHFKDEIPSNPPHWATKQTFSIPNSIDIEKLLRSSLQRPSTVSDQYYHDSCPLIGMPGPQYEGFTITLNPNQRSDAVSSMQRT